MFNKVKSYSIRTKTQRVIAVTLATCIACCWTVTSWAQTPKNPNPNQMIISGAMNEYQAGIIARMEARNAGLKMTKKATSVKLKVTDSYGNKVTIDYKLDCGDRKTGVSFEFVSKFNCSEMYGQGTKVTPAELAKMIKKALVAAKKDKKTMVLVEDPKGDYGKQSEKLRADMKAFIKKLKKDGVIK